MGSRQLKGWGFAFVTFGVWAATGRKGEKNQKHGELVARQNGGVLELVETMKARNSVLLS